MIVVITAESVVSATEVLVASSAVAVTLTVFLTPPASMAACVTANVAVKVTSSPTSNVGTLVSGSDVKVVFTSVELSNTGAASNDRLSPKMSVKVSVIAIPVRAVLPVLVTTIAVSYTHLTLPTKA